MIKKKKKKNYFFLKNCVIDPTSKLLVNERLFILFYHKKEKKPEGHTQKQNKHKKRKLSKMLYFSMRQYANAASRRIVTRHREIIFS